MSGEPKLYPQPLDMLHFKDDEGRTVIVHTHLQSVWVAVQMNGKTIHAEHYTPSQFISLFMRDAGGPG